MTSPADIPAVPQTPTTRQIFEMSWPMAMRAVMLVSLIIIDLYLVSSLGEEAVAAIGIAGVITGLAMGANLAFANAMQIKVAQAYGTGDTLALKTAFFGVLSISLTLVLNSLLQIVAFGCALLDGLAHSLDIADGVASYLFVLVLNAEALSGALTSLFNGFGWTQLSF